jgi:hypothetical protein
MCSSVSGIRYSPNDFEILKESNMHTINVYNNQSAVINEYESGTASPPANTSSHVDGRTQPGGGNGSEGNGDGRGIPGKPPVLPAHRDQEDQLGTIRNDVTGMRKDMDSMRGTVQALQISQNGMHNTLNNVSAAQSRVEVNTTRTAANTTAITTQLELLKDQVDALKSCCGSQP